MPKPVHRPASQTAARSKEEQQQKRKADELMKDDTICEDMDEGSAFGRSSKLQRTPVKANNNPPKRTKKDELNDTMVEMDTQSSPTPPEPAPQKGGQQVDEQKKNVEPKEVQAPPQPGTSGAVRVEKKQESSEVPDKNRAQTLMQASKQAANAGFHRASKLLSRRAELQLERSYLGSAKKACDKRSNKSSPDVGSDMTQDLTIERINKKTAPIQKIQGEHPSLHFSPALPAQNYGSKEKALFQEQPQRTELVKGGEPERGEGEENHASMKEGTQRNQVQKGPGVRAPGTEAVELSIPGESATRLRCSVSNIREHIEDNMEFISSEDKLAIINAQEALRKRIQTFCTVRGHLLCAEGQMVKGNRLLVLGESLEKEMQEAVALLLTIPSETDGEKTKSRLSSTKIQEEDSIESETQAFHTGPKDTKNQYRTAKNSRFKTATRDTGAQRSYKRENTQTRGNCGLPNSLKMTQDQLADYRSEAEGLQRSSRIQSHHKLPSVVDLVSNISKPETRGQTEEQEDIPLDERSIEVQVAQQALHQAQKEYEAAVEMSLIRKRERLRSLPDLQGSLTSREKEAPTRMNQGEVHIKASIPSGPFTSRRGKLGSAREGSLGTKKGASTYRPRASSLPFSDFRSHGQDEGDAYYMALPVPWNIQPASMSGNLESLLNLQKGGLLPTFGGSPDHYINFRTTFISLIHSARAGVFAKDMFLRHSLKSCDNMQKLLAVAPPGPVGYSMLISRLEEKFGGHMKAMDYQLTKIKRFQQLQAGQTEALEDFIDTVQGYMAVLETEGQSNPSTHSFYNLILSKLTSELRLKYHGYSVDNPSPQPHDTDHLLAWMSRYLLGPWRREPALFKRKENVPPKGQVQAPRNPPVKSPELKLRAVPAGGRQFQAQAQGSKPCPKCHGAHYLGKCPAYLKLDPKQRELTVKQAGLCYRCLQSGHMIRECRRTWVCDKCQGRHHSTLHGARPAPGGPVELLKKNQEQNQAPGRINRASGDAEDRSPSIEQQNESALQAETSLAPDVIPSSSELEQRAAMLPADMKLHYYFRCYQAEASQETISLRFAVATVMNPKTGKKKTIGILLDDGSNMTLLASSTAEYLGLEGSTHPLAVLGVGGQQQSHQSLVSVLRLAHVNGSIEKNIVIRTMPNPTGGLEVTRWHKYADQWPHLKNLPLLETPAGLKVEMILGNDQGYFHRSLQEVYHPTDIEAPVARLTTLGWTVTGRLLPRSQPHRGPTVMKSIASVFKATVKADTRPTFCQQSEMKLGQEKEIPLATKWVKPEHFGDPLDDDYRPPIINPDDRTAMNILQAGTQQLPSGKVQAPVLWKGEMRPPNNFQAAKQVWLRLKKRLEANPEQYQAYDTNFQKWLDSGYARVVPEEEEDPQAEDLFYLTHFPVIREDKQTTKLRVEIWIKFDQAEHYSTERECLINGVRPKGQIWNQYDLYYEEGMIKLGGRTRREAKPILHSKSSMLAKWLKHLHDTTLRHAGGWKVLLNESRKHFWVFGAYHLIKNIIKNCVQCKRRSPVPLKQRMAPLPTNRFENQSHAAFESIAVDFAGPWYVKIGPGQARQSRLVLVICCTTLRAMRCEIVTRKETSNVLLALQRFAARQRIPKEIYSDNAAEFKRAAKELSMLDTWNQPATLLAPEWQKVTWSHCYPLAPHSNGVVESMVGVAKRAIEKVLAPLPLTDETLMTVCIFAEEIANSRPMGNISMDPRDPQPLTPGMFIGGQPMGQPMRIPPGGGKFTEMWKQMNQVREKLYDRFQAEIVPELEKRDKWWDVVPELKVDDVVVCLNCEPTKDGRWPLGRVAEVEYGHDGLPRGAWVWVNQNFKRRHIHHLMPLI